MLFERVCLVGSMLGRESRIRKEVARKVTEGESDRGGLSNVLYP